MSDNASTARGLLSRALSLEENGDIKGALKVHEQIVEIEPNNVWSINTVSGLYGVLHEYREQIQWALRALQIKSDFGGAWVNLGNGLVGIGSLDKAEVAYSGALSEAVRARLDDLSLLEPDPDTVSAASRDGDAAIAIYGLGVVAEQRRNWNDALKYYEFAIAVSPDFENAHYNAAMIYANIARFADAILHLKRVLELNSEAEDTKGILAELEARLRRDSKKTQL